MRIRSFTPADEDGLAILWIEQPGVPLQKNIAKEHPA
jgi:hypothetical protein